jgi:hypothetical protein
MFSKCASVASLSFILHKEFAVSKPSTNEKHRMSLTAEVMSWRREVRPRRSDVRHRRRVVKHLRRGVRGRTRWGDWVRTQRGDAR